MVMARVQVKSSKITGTVGKLNIEARGPFRVIEDLSNGSYLCNPWMSRIVLGVDFHSRYVCSFSLDFALYRC